ncbi:MAG: restriction endonuclease [Candidatus Latescibacteria bacterium]|nr:restriction endonuclease [Candidatus Latescibacterota bacterium]
MNKDSGKNIKEKIEQALEILKSIGLPKQQHNDRSALTLLALLGLKPNENWADARAPLLGITPIMDFIRNHYEKEYAPNTRETIRRQTMHQFVDAGIAVPNPDRPNRPVNSPKWCYQIAPDALEFIRSFNTKLWDENLSAYLKGRATLAEQYAKERDMQMIPLKINRDIKLALTPGKHSKLIKDIITKFGPLYAPGAEVLYVGDTGFKMGHFDKDVLESLGLTFDSHGKFPDVVLYLREKNWLLLIESVTSHGPVDAKRHSELASLFAESTACIVYVTAFPDRQTMAKYLGDISWETEVWVADAATHLIHFNGERFLGPYK